MSRASAESRGPRAAGRGPRAVSFRAMPYDPGLVARIADSLASIGERGVRQKNVFGGRGFMAGKSAFAIAWDGGLIVKCPRAEYAAALAEPGVTPFAPDGERPMTTWVVVAEDAIADDPELGAWLARGLRAVRGG